LEEEKPYSAERSRLKKTRMQDAVNGGHIICSRLLKILSL
jgi:hypothetical protein